MRTKNRSLTSLWNCLCINHLLYPILLTWFIKWLRLLFTMVWYIVRFHGRLIVVHWSHLFNFFLSFWKSCPFFYFSYQTCYKRSTPRMNCKLSIDITWEISGFRFASNLHVSKVTWKYPTSFRSFMTKTFYFGKQFDIECEYKDSSLIWY